MSELRLFVPDPSLEQERLLVVENALTEGGLIDRHLRWVPQKESPSSGISARDYGHMPTRYLIDVEPVSVRPSEEPVDYQLIATTVLGLPYDGDQSVLVGKVAETEAGWYKFLVDTETLTELDAAAMQEAAAGAYRLGTLTEDNLPTYVSGLVQALTGSAARDGLELPATKEWLNIWSGEEHGHGVGMNAHGLYTGLTRSPEQVAGRNSQLRAGMDVTLTDVIQTFAYVAWQELSTNYAHKRNGDLLGPVGNALMSEISADEAKHHNLYLDVLRALLKAFPDDTVRVLHDVLTTRFMPGSRGIPDFRRRTLGIHNSGVFGSDHGHMAARSVLSKLHLLRPEAEELLETDAAKAALFALKSEFGGKKVVERRSNIPFVLGRNVTELALRTARKLYSQRVGLPERYPTYTG